MAFSAEVLLAIQAAAKVHQIQSPLLAAFAQVESEGRQFATRYEPEDGEYVTQAAHFAILARTTLATETVHQLTSWGLLQIMGFNVRTLGFNGNLPELCIAATGLAYGCAWMNHLRREFKIQPDDKALDFDEALACAWNHGHPERAADGTWVVQGYVDSVKAAWEGFKAAGG